MPSKTALTRPFGGREAKGEMCLVKKPKIKSSEEDQKDPAVIRNPFLDGLLGNIAALRGGRNSLRIPLIDPLKIPIGGGVGGGVGGGGSGGGGGGSSSGGSGGGSTSTSGGSSTGGGSQRGTDPFGSLSFQ